MTEAEWEKEARCLNRAIGRHQRAAKKAEKLADRIEAQAKARVAIEALRLHRLNRFSLVP